MDNSPAVPGDESARLDALYRLNLLDTAPSESFDRITRMAGQIFGLPIAAVSLTDHDRQWFKSRIGVSHWSIPRHKAPCAQVAESAETLVINDLQADSCYRSSLLADQGVRFYAGASLTTRDGHSLGALCVLGTEPRGVTAAEIDALNDLAKMVMTQVELQHAFGRLDPVSGLPNRTQFLEDIADLGRDRPGERRLAVLVDLARHDQVDHALRVMGADYLDEMVRETARLLSNVLGRGRVAYHVAGTQFAFLAPPASDEEPYLAILIEVLAKMQTEARDRFTMAASIGVAPFLAGETRPSTVLRTAHSAAQEARAQPSMVSLYSAAQDIAQRRRFRLIEDFGKALASHDQLSLVFQPRIDLARRLCTGAEALLRWEHPELGSISPAEFIPVIEQTALAGPTTAWVIGAALDHAARWRASGSALQLSVNVSAANLEDPAFAAKVSLELAQRRLRPEHLEIEVTESAIMSDVTAAAGQLALLATAGISIAIDDFGTGQSSLSYLQRLPARVLKIDQSFIRDAMHNERQRTLVRSMISMAHDLRYRVVAEGIEDADVCSWLYDVGCDEGQGYYFAKPMSDELFSAWLDRWLGAAEPGDVLAA